MILDSGLLFWATLFNDVRLDSHQFTTRKRSRFTFTGC